VGNHTVKAVNFAGPLGTGRRAATTIPATASAVMTVIDHPAIADITPRVVPTGIGTLVVGIVVPVVTLFPRSHDAVATASVVASIRAGIGV